MRRVPGLMGMSLPTCLLAHFSRQRQDPAKAAQSTLLAKGCVNSAALRCRTRRSAGRAAGGGLICKGSRCARQTRAPLSTGHCILGLIIQELNPAMACLEVVGKLRAWHRASPRVTRCHSLKTAACCEALAALSIRLRQAAFDVSRGHLERSAAEWLWCGRQVKVGDGTGFSMSNTPAIQTRWPQHREQKKGYGFPAAKILGAFSLSTVGGLGAWSY